MQKLTIVVNCTDRKSVVPTSDLRMRSLSVDHEDARFSLWRRRLGSATAEVRLLDLYQGEAWVQAKGLAQDARDQGAQVRMLVASAGLGLMDVTRHAPSYAATFALGHADSVTGDVKRTSKWWRQLGELPRATALSNVARDPILLVLSESYARAMDADLVELAKRGGDYLLVGGWRSVDGLPRLKSDRDLRRTLGGTVSSINLRMARKWMARRSTSSLYSQFDTTRWEKWARGARSPEMYQRVPLNDDELVELVTGLRLEDPTLSATRALRLIRDRGMACEQKRFGMLFRHILETEAR